jgi:hypothetical protein
MTYPLDRCALLFVVQCLLYLTVLSELALAKPLGDTLQTKAVFAFIMGIAVREVGGFPSKRVPMYCQNWTKIQNANRFFATLLAIKSPVLRGNSISLQPSRKEIYVRAF